MIKNAVSQRIVVSQGSYFIDKMFAKEWHGLTVFAQNTILAL